MRPSLGGWRRWVSSSVVARTSVVLSLFSADAFPLPLLVAVEVGPVGVEVEFVVGGEAGFPRSRLDFSLEVMSEEDEGALEGSCRCMVRWADVEVGSIRRV